MDAPTVAPLVFAVAVALVTTGTHRRARPEVAAALVAAALLGAALAAVPTVGVLALGFLAHFPLLDAGVDWCHTVLGVHANVNPWLGAAATFMLVLGAIRVTPVLRAWRRHRCCDPGEPAVVESDELFAYSLPGPGRRIALSSALVETLDVAELDVVIAHERGHADHRHDRHLLLGDVAVALVPPLAPLRRRLRFALERWADETAVSAVGGDRELVARTLARVALAQPADLDRGMAFHGLGVAARVEALMRPGDTSNEGWWSSTMVLGVSVVLLAAAVQAHHLTALLTTLCPG